MAKGGNLVLNAGGMPNGKLPSPALTRMKAIGAWLKTFGDAIYSTKPKFPYFVGNIGLTHAEDRVYAIRMVNENERIREMNFPHADPVKSVTMLGRGCPLRYIHHNDMLCVEIPELNQDEQIAFAIAINPV